MRTPLPSLKDPRPISALAALAALALASCARDQGRPSPATGESRFVTEIKPLLEQRCLPCHNGRVLEGRFNLASRATALQPGPSGPAIVPGNPGASRLLTVVLAASEHPQAMPPTGHGLSEVEIKILEDWICEGAPWPEGRPGNLAPPRGAEPRSVNATLPAAVRVS